MSEGIPIRQVFSLSASFNRTSGIQGYEVPRLYADPLKQIEERELSQKKSRPKRKITKRGNYLQDQEKLHKIVPGPGKYKFKDEWPQKSKLKSKHLQRLTYIEQLVKRQKKEKRPAPGQYKIEKSIKEIEAEKKRLSARKIKEPERVTYLDGVQAQAAWRPGIGNYNIRRRAQTEMSFSKHKEKPEEMRKKHAEQSKKKEPKRPSMTTYSPNPCDYSLFSTMSKGKSKNGFGKTTRFKTTQSGSGINPTKYGILQEWAGKGKKIERHGMEVLSKARVHTSVYY